MSRKTARPLCRLLAGALAATILGGCGQATPVIEAPAGGRPLRFHSDHEHKPVEMIAISAEPRQVVPAWYPADPLPAIVGPTRPAEAPPTAEARAIAPAEPVSQPADDTPDDTPAGSPGKLAFESAYAVTPQRSANPGDLLVPLSGPSDPTPQLVAVARQADMHVNRAFRLAERGAQFTARAELRQALALAAAALDEQRNTNAHSRALQNGLCALNEVEDFVAAARTTGRAARTVESIVQSHQTPVLRGEPADEQTTSRAIERYLGYAQEQLAAAAGDLQPAASALYALGKLEMAGATDIGSLESARAAVYLQAALIVNPRHALAANELGVLLARHGRLVEAKAALSHTLRIASLPAAWRNLSIVHHGLGEMDLASQADRQWQQAARAQSQNAAADQGPGAVQWVDPTTFAQSTQASVDVPAAGQVNQPAAAPVVADKTGKEHAKNASSWFPWLNKSR